MPVGLTSFGRQLLTKGEAAVRLPFPVLVWEAVRESDPELLLATGGGDAPRRPSTGEPLVYEVKKQVNPAMPNAFGLGVTLGRTKNNDLVVPDNSISRVHAYLQVNAKSEWTVSDAESRNGTWADGVKLEARAVAVLEDGSRLKFGNVEMVYLSPEGFLTYLRRKLQLQR